jgi:hypothetical protein
MTGLTGDTSGVVNHVSLGMLSMMCDDGQVNDPPVAASPPQACKSQARDRLTDTN